MNISIGWSEFARGRHQAGQGRSYFLGTEDELVALVVAQWDAREPGAGRPDLEQVVVVPVAADKFVCGTVALTDDMVVHAEVVRRQPHEDPHVRVTAEGEPEPAKFAKVVLYSAATLLENDGNRSCDSDWEIVSIIASPIDNEPMGPLTMARNMLGKPGGTPVQYSAEAFAKSIYYWSQRAASATKT